MVVFEDDLSIGVPDPHSDDFYAGKIFQRLLVEVWLLFTHTKMYISQILYDDRR
jgi:hypothetical protein